MDMENLSDDFIAGVACGITMVENHFSKAVIETLSDPKAEEVDPKVKSGYAMTMKGVILALGQFREMADIEIKSRGIDLKALANSFGVTESDASKHEPFPGNYL